MPKIIEKIDYYPCGYCKNDQALLFKKEQKRKLTFPAGVFLIKHRVHGYLLYDTGYTVEVLQKKWLYKLYNLITPVVINREQMIDQQLQSSGIQPEEITTILLSHLHPDHIGGTNYFPNARFILSKGCFEAYQKKQKRALIFSDFLPDDFEERIDVVTSATKTTVFPYKESYDFFGDGSLFVCEFDGHAKGQLCMYFPEYRLFIGADIVWGTDLIEKTASMRWLPKMIQDNRVAYKKSSECLAQMLTDGHQVLVSHDPEEKIRQVLG